MPQPRPSPAALVTRTVLWIVISSVFIFSNLRRIAAFRAANLAPTIWAYAQLGLWCVALVFWLCTGWRDWTRRDRDR
jgi:hypothetical protein